VKKVAVNRPDFSRKTKSQKKSNVPSLGNMLKARLEKKSAPKALRSKSKKKGLTPFKACLYLLLIGLLFLESGWPPGSGVKEVSAQTNNESEETPPLPERREERTTILGNVGMTSEQMKKVAENILFVANSMTDEFYVADGLTLSMYILRYLAEIGEYEISYKDIMVLVNAFEKLSGRSVGDDVLRVLEQVRKIRFGKKNGNYFSQFFAKNPARGIVINIDEPGSDPDGSLKRIDKVTILEGSVLSFNEIDSASEKKHVRDFIKTPIKILGVIEAVVDALYQIHPAIIDTIDDYLEWSEFPAPPMMIDMQGISVDVETSTLFGDINFKFSRAYAFPAMKNNQGNVPTFVLDGKAKLLRLKVSVDQ
jgi:hypothetical protein